MTMRRWSKPSAFAWALLVIGIAAFSWLGIWQLDRARQKEELLAAFATAANEAPQNFVSVRDNVDAQRYPHVRVSGHYLTDRAYLRDEQMHDGHLGVHAI